MGELLAGRGTQSRAVPPEQQNLRLGLGQKPGVSWRPMGLAALITKPGKTFCWPSSDEPTAEQRELEVPLHDRRGCASRELAVPVHD